VPGIVLEEYFGEDESERCENGKMAEQRHLLGMVDMDLDLA
jgi:hypothetical protein